MRSMTKVKCDYQNMDASRNFFTYLPMSRGRYTIGVVCLLVIATMCIAGITEALTPTCCTDRTVERYKRDTGDNSTTPSTSPSTTTSTTQSTTPSTTTSTTQSTTSSSTPSTTLSTTTSTTQSPTSSTTPSTTISQTQSTSTTPRTTSSTTLSTTSITHSTTKSTAPSSSTMQSTTNSTTQSTTTSKTTTSLGTTLKPNETSEGIRRYFFHTFFSFILSSVFFLSARRMGNLCSYDGRGWQRLDRNRLSSVQSFRQRPLRFMLGQRVSKHMLAGRGEAGFGHSKLYGLLQPNRLVSILVPVRAKVCDIRTRQLDLLACKPKRPLSVSPHRQFLHLRGKQKQH